jgi:hypothetical protein
MASSISTMKPSGNGIADPPLNISNIFQVDIGAGRIGANAAAVRAAAGAEG